MRGRRVRARAVLRLIEEDHRLGYVREHAVELRRQRSLDRVLEALIFVTCFRDEAPPTRRR
jgi:hypothetical protein